MPTAVKAAEAFLHDPKDIATARTNALLGTTIEEDMNHLSIEWVPTNQLASQQINRHGPFSEGYFRTATAFSRYAFEIRHLAPRQALSARILNDKKVKKSTNTNPNEDGEIKRALTHLNTEMGRFITPEDIEWEMETQILIEKKHAEEKEAGIKTPP